MFNENIKKPIWLRKKIFFKAQKEVDKILNSAGVSTICQEAKCPNRFFCFSKVSVDPDHLRPSDGFSQGLRTINFHLAEGSRALNSE